jgi:hypothetical protein
MRALYFFNILKSMASMSYVSVSFSTAAPAMRPYVPAVVAGPVVARAHELLLASCEVDPAKAKLNPVVELQELCLSSRCAPTHHDTNATHTCSQPPGLTGIVVSIRAGCFQVGLAVVASCSSCFLQVL